MESRIGEQKIIGGSSQVIRLILNGFHAQKHRKSVLLIGAQRAGKIQCIIPDQILLDHSSFVQGSRVINGLGKALFEELFIAKEEITA